MKSFPTRIIATKKTKKSTSNKGAIVTRNFETPLGEQRQKQRATFSNMPCVCCAAPSGSFIVADGDTVFGMKHTTLDVKTVAAVNSSVTDLCINREFLAVASVETISLWKGIEKISGIYFKAKMS